MHYSNQYKISGIAASRLRSGSKKIFHHFKAKIQEIVAPNILFYVISHERSGTHFLMNTILRNTYIRQGKGYHAFAKSLNRHLKGYHCIAEWFGPYDNPSKRFDHIDAFNSHWQNAHEHASIIKSHCERPLFEARYQNAKVLYILRDPRDTMVSWFHYLNKIHRLNPLIDDHSCTSFSSFLRNPASPFLRYGYSLKGNFSNVAERWASHVSGWTVAPNTMVIRYENLKCDYREVLKKISKFLGIRLKFRTSEVSLHSAPAMLPRKGIVGDWKTLFTSADEDFLRDTVERMGINWHDVVCKNP